MSNLKPLKKSLLTVNPSKKLSEFLDSIKFEKPLLSVQDLVYVHERLQDRNIKNDGEKLYIHELLEDSTIKLPENEMVKRSAELDTRCTILTNKILNDDYLRATKNIWKNFENQENLAYELKEVNKYLWATLQVFISIFCCFFFGFFGIEMATEQPTMETRITSGVVCSLITLVAEMYFFVKKVQ